MTGMSATRYFRGTSNDRARLTRATSSGLIRKLANQNCLIDRFGSLTVTRTYDTDAAITRADYRLPIFERVG